MSLILRTTTFLGLVFASTYSFGCMPLSADNTLLARLESIEPANQVPSYTSDKTGYLLHLSQPKFVFGSMWDRLTKTAPPQLEATFDPNNVQPPQLVIALADTYSAPKPEKYRAYAIAAVTCDNDVITLGKPMLAPDNPGWNRQTQQCGASESAGILDGFVGDKSQADYLAQLQAKYPTCEMLYAAFSDAQSVSQKGFWHWLKQLFG